MRTDKTVVPLRETSREKATKTDAERQKQHYERRRAAGWRKTWIDPATLSLADELGGIEHVVPHRDRLVQLIRDQDAALAVLGEELDTLRNETVIAFLRRKILGA